MFRNVISGSLRNIPTWALEGRYLNTEHISWVGYLGFQTLFKSQNNKLKEAKTFWNLGAGFCHYVRPLSHSFDQNKIVIIVTQLYSNTALGNINNPNNSPAPIDHKTLLTRLCHQSLHVLKADQWQVFDPPWLVTSLDYSEFSRATNGDSKPAFQACDIPSCLNGK